MALGQFENLDALVGRRVEVAEMFTQAASGHSWLYPQHDEYESTAKQVGPKMQELYLGRAAMLRAALDQHTQLRDRFLEQSMLVRELEAKVA